MLEGGAIPRVNKMTKNATLLLTGCPPSPLPSSTESAEMEELCSSYVSLVCLTH